MSTKTQHTDNHLFYFITFTCWNWLPLIQMTNLYSEIYKWFDILKSKNNPVVGYVIMPNHVHLMLYLNKEEKALNPIIANGKRFLAYEIIKRLKKQKNHDVLNKLKEAVSVKDSKRGKKHQVFIPSFDAKPCLYFDFIAQKMNYMHNNPIGKKWRLVESQEEYLHSSAQFYMKGKQGIYKVVDFRSFDLFDGSYGREINL